MPLTLPHNIVAADHKEPGDSSSLPGLPGRHTGHVTRDVGHRAAFLKQCVTTAPPQTCNGVAGCSWRSHRLSTAGGRGVDCERAPQSGLSRGPTRVVPPGDIPEKGGGGQEPEGEGRLSVHTKQDGQGSPPRRNRDRDVSEDETGMIPHSLGLAKYNYLSQRTQLGCLPSRVLPAVSTEHSEQGRAGEGVYT